MTMTMQIDKQQLKEHANRAIGFILDKAGVPYAENGLSIYAPCPCMHHDGDGNNVKAFSWRHDFAQWRCWTHSCEQKYGGDIIGLVRSVIGKNYPQTLAWIHDVLTEQDIDLTEHCEAPNRKSNNLPKVHRPLDELRLKFLSPHPQYLLNRGFDLGVMAKYEVGYWRKLGTYMHDRIVFPIRDHDNFLVGFTGRTIHSQSDWQCHNITSKWLHGRYFDRYPQQGDFSKASVLYNLNNAKLHIGQDRKVILVEGPLDGLKLEEAGIHHWVAVLGCDLSVAHTTLLIRLGINELILALDPDNAGDSAGDRVIKHYGDLFHFRRIKLPTDPGDMSADQIRDLFYED